MHKELKIKETTETASSTSLFCFVFTFTVNWTPFVSFLPDSMTRERLLPQAQVTLAGFGYPV
jgi:hypothetical protein